MNRDQNSNWKYLVERQSWAPMEYPKEIDGRLVIPVTQREWDALFRITLKEERYFEESIVEYPALRLKKVIVYADQRVPRTYVPLMGAEMIYRYDNDMPDTGDCVLAYCPR